MCTTTSEPQPESESEEQQEYDDDWDENVQTIRGKFMFENAKTLDEVIEMIENFKQYVLELKDEGWELIEEVTDDYGHIRIKNQ
jgi:hypothetical protein